MIHGRFQNYIPKRPLDKGIIATAASLTLLFVDGLWQLDCYSHEKLLSVNISNKLCDIVFPPLNELLRKCAGDR